MDLGRLVDKTPAVVFEPADVDQLAAVLLDPDGLCNPR